MKYDVSIFTPTELKIFRLFHKGYGNHAIAKALGMKEKTIRSFHMVNIYRKLGFPGGSSKTKKSRYVMKYLAQFEEGV